MGAVIPWTPWQVLIQAFVSCLICNCHAADARVLWERGGVERNLYSTGDGAGEVGMVDTDEAS